MSRTWRGGPEQIHVEEQFEMLKDHGVSVIVDPIGYSRVSGMSGGTVGTAEDTDLSELALRSTLNSTEVMEQYHAQAEKLKRDLHVHRLCQNILNAYRTRAFGG